MPYIDGIPRAGGYTIDIFEAGSTVGITVFNIRRDRLSEIESLVLVPDNTNSATTGQRTIGSGVTRLLIFASAFSGTTARMRVGGTSIALAPDGMLQIDVI